MEDALLANPDRVAQVSLAAGDSRVTLSLRLTDAFTGGDLVRFSLGATTSIEGCDELSSSYDRANWASGITSGVLYAFRALRIPRRCVVVTELTGRLRAGDMDALASGSSVAIAKLVGKELPAFSLEGWAIQSVVTERDRAPGATLSQGSGPVSPKRRLELRALSSAQLLSLLAEVKAESELPVNELRLIHDIAAERVEDGDAQAGSVLAEVDSYLSEVEPLDTPA